ANQAITPATLSVTATVKNTSTPSVPSTSHGGRPHVTTGMTAAATNTSLKHETASAQGTAATTAGAATSTKRGRPSTRARRQTMATGDPTATATSSTTSTHTGTQTAPTSPARTVRPRPAPQPSAIPTGTYTLSDGNRTCVKAVMGLQLLARNAREEQIEYVTVNPNATQISGSCGMVQSELNLTFSGGYVNFTFVK
ncbi:LAMP3 protein, partial [Erpornis zantholeuca]|nr:LAMP3 protein [Erpornis zantholeuca]